MIFCLATAASLMGLLEKAIFLKYNSFFFSRFSGFDSMIVFSFHFIRLNCTHFLKPSIEIAILVLVLLLK